MVESGFEKQHLQRFREQLLAWYRSHHRPLPWRTTRDPYRIWVSEVMLQQTQVRTVLEYYPRFLARFPTLAALAAAPLDAVLKAWEGLGYYGRARNFHRAAGLVMEQYGGCIPEDPEQFIRLPGVGEYTCAAVLSFSFGLALPVLDGNVKRVLARLVALPHPTHKAAGSRILKMLAKQLLDPRDPARFNQAMMELGSLICTPTAPECNHCPVRSTCRAAHLGRPENFPRTPARKRIPTVPVAVAVVRRNSQVLITRRKEEGLLGGLWEFPGGKLKPGEAPEEACLRELHEETGIQARVECHLARVKHAYSHFKIAMDVYLCHYLEGEVQLNGPVDFRWIRLDELSAFAFPKANHKFFPALRAALAPTSRPNTAGNGPATQPSTAAQGGESRPTRCSNSEPPPGC